MADPRLSGNDLREFRSITGLSQVAAAERVGLSVSTWKSYEQGRSPVSRRVERAVRRILANEPRDEAGEDVGAVAAPAGEPSEAADLSGDLPPLAEPPDPDESEFVQMPGGKAVPVNRLDHFARLELSILTLLAGKEIVYLVDTGAGKPERRSSHQPGLADLFPPADRAAIIEGSPRIAHAWVEWARTNKRVDAFLSLMIVEGGFSGVVVATLPVVLTILGNHGLDPLGWISRQIGPPPTVSNGAGPGAAEQPEFDPYADGAGGYPG